MPKQSAKNKIRLQLVLTVLLIGFPVAMIFVNGKDAITGILWVDEENKPSTEQVERIDSTSDEVSPANNNNLFFGLYDPEQQFQNDTLFAVEHYYISWADFTDSIVLSDLKAIVQSVRKPFLTIEPWPLSKNGDLLKDITTGRYDSIITRITHLLNNLNSSVYLSWGHEMDQDLTDRYAWSGKNPADFAAAYQYVHSNIEAAVENDITWVWAPVIKTGFQKYWPGNEYVDVLGMPIYSFPDFDRSYYGYIRNFSTTMNEKYHMVKSYKKPIIIVELGVTGSGDFQNFWLSDAFHHFGSYNLLQGIIFFQSADTPGAWGEQLPTPDWRIHPETVTSLIAWFNTDGQ